MDKKFYGDSGRNSSSYGHNRNIQPMEGVNSNFGFIVGLMVIAAIGLTAFALFG